MAIGTITRTAGRWSPPGNSKVPASFPPVVQIRELHSTITPMNRPMTGRMMPPMTRRISAAISRSVDGVGD
jgi:hypothetical protein